MNRIVAVLIALLLIAVPSILADSNFDHGLQFYNQGNFQAAAKYFDIAIGSPPVDPTAIYYDALCYHQLHNLNRARMLYMLAQKTAPNSDVARLSAMALQAMSGSSPTNNNVANYGSSSGSDTLPDETKVYFTRQGNVLLIDVEINNRPTQMMFDTGASMCVIGKNQLQQLSIHPPEGQAIGAASGVGTSGKVPIWATRVSIKVGGIVRRNFPIAVQEQLMGEPLLGQTFFKDYQYSIDNGAQSITFKRKSTYQNAGADNYSVPFAREGNELVVTVDVNGHSCPMYFDTGASTIAFSGSQIAALGIAVPDDAQTVASYGIGGMTQSRVFTVNRMKLGPIDKSDVTVMVVDQSNLPRPLLGQTFIQGWQYTIDNNQHVIHFIRR